MAVARRFRADQSGATAILFGMSLLPLMGLVGGAVDYSRAAYIQSSLQRAADATALALTRDPANTSRADLNAHAQSVFGATFKSQSYVKTSPLEVRRQGKTIHVSAKGTVTNAMLQVVGLKQIPVHVEAAASSGSQRIELALVLDNTGSMDERVDGKRKIDELKIQATKLLSRLRDVATDKDSVKVSVVPFDTEVRLDADAYRDKPWFRWDRQRDSRDWTGYVYDRFGSYATTDEAPSAGPSLYPAPRDTEYHTNRDLERQSRGDLVAIRPLTSVAQRKSFDQLTNLIQGMQPRGFTNIALGVTWGLATLSQSEPFNEAAPFSDPDVKRFMVVLTDGNNTMNHIDGSLNQNVGRIDANTRAACEQVKKSPIQLFTIRLLDGNADLLRNCSSGEGYYFNVQNTGDLSRAFKNITDAILATRITS